MGATTGKIKPNSEIIGEKRKYNSPKNGRFIPGNPGKPVGATKRLKLSDELMKELSKPVPGRKETYIVLLVKAMLYGAIVKGDPQLMKLVFNYVDGMPTQTVNQTTSLKMSMSEVLKQLDNDGNTVNTDEAPQ